MKPHMNCSIGEANPIKVFGSKANAHESKEKRSKLCDRDEKGIMINYFPECNSLFPESENKQNCSEQGYMFDKNDRRDTSYANVDYLVDETLSQVLLLDCELLHREEMYITSKM